MTNWAIFLEGIAAKGFHTVFSRRGPKMDIIHCPQEVHNGSWDKYHTFFYYFLLTYPFLCFRHFMGVIMLVTRKHF